MKGLPRKVLIARAWRGVVLTSLLSLLVAASAPSVAAERERFAAVPGEIIVGFEPAVLETAEDDVLAAAGAVQEEEFEEIDAALVEVDPEDVEQALKVLQADPRVEYAEPNALLYATAEPVPVPSDGEFAQLWGLDNVGQPVNGATGVEDADIDAREAWAVTTGSADVVVGVVDTGIDFSHEDLGGSADASPLLWINPGEDCPGCRSDGVDNDGNGYVDDWRGWDFVNDDNDPTDDNGHGTHVSGTIGAIGNNGVGVAGVTWKVRLMPLKFLGAGGSGATADAVEAVLYGARMGAQITNNSWGGGRFSQALLDAVKEADRLGSLFVAAAGNAGGDNDRTPLYPSTYAAPNVISVAATDSADRVPSFSNVGSTTVDLGAPGVNIYSTWLRNSYRHASGTSMATAVVTGAAALAKAAFPGAGHLGLKSLLLHTADPVEALTPRTATGGRLNVARAVECAGTPLLAVEEPSEGFRANVGDPIAVAVLATDCASVEGVAVSAEVNGAPIALTARGDGLYVGEHIANEAGPVTLRASAAVSETTKTTEISGSAVANYRIEEVPFEWLDATVGTEAGLTCDDCSVTVPLEFAFRLYGEERTSVEISSNGFISFGPGPLRSSVNGALPNPATPNGIVAPLWDDLNPAAGGAVWYATLGTAPTRRFVVAWVAVPRFTNVGDATFELVLEEGSNEILFQYQDAGFGNAAYDLGASATIGLESTDGTIGRQFSRDQASLAGFEATKSIRFRGP